MICKHCQTEIYVCDYDNDYYHVWGGNHFCANGAPLSVAQAFDDRIHRHRHGAEPDDDSVIAAELLEIKPESWPERDILAPHALN